MRLKATIDTYKLPKDLLDIRQAYLLIGKLHYALHYVPHMHILQMKQEIGKLLGIPSVISLLVDKGKPYLVLYPAPKKAWKLHINFARLDTI